MDNTPGFAKSISLSNWSYHNEVGNMTTMADKQKMTGSIQALKTNSAY